MAQTALAAWRRLTQHKLIINAGTYVSGYVIQKAVGFLLIPLWARFLTPEDYGITGTLLAYSGVLAAVLALGIHGAAVRHYYDFVQDPAGRKRYVSSIILFQVAFLALVIGALSTWGGQLWGRLTANAIPFDPYVRLMLWYTFFDVLSLVPVGLYQAQEKARQFVAAQYGRFFMNVAASLMLVVLLRRGALGVLWSQLLAAVVVTLIVMAFAARTWFEPRVGWRYVREALGFGLPLVPHALASWILQAADRTILEHNVSLTELGLYNFGYTLGMGMQFLVTGINQAWTPHYFRLMSAGPGSSSKVVRALTSYVAALGAVCLVAVLFAREAVVLLMPEKYHPSVAYIRPVLAGYFMLGFYFIVVAPLFYYKRTKLIPLLTAGAAAVNIGLNLWLIPRYGAVAAAWVTLITYALLATVATAAARRVQPLPYPLARYGVIVAMLLAATVAVAPLESLGAVAWPAKALVLAVFGWVAWRLLLAPVMRGNNG